MYSERVASASLEYEGLMYIDVGGACLGCAWVLHEYPSLALLESLGLDRRGVYVFSSGHCIISAWLESFT